MVKRIRAAAATAVLAALLAGCSSSTAPPAPRPEPSGSTSANGATPHYPQAAPSQLAGKVGTPPVQLPDAAQVNSQDPAAVSRAAVTVIWTMDTDIDVSQHNAEVRATPFYSARHAAEVANAAPQAAPGADWAQWSQHRAYTTVALRPANEDGRPSDTPTEATYRWSLTLNPIGRDGWHGTPQTMAVLTVLTRDDPSQPWRLDSLTLQ
ncbi:hypothetical protein [Kitasatospora kifunensis]|uniref:Lipoprotein n=1 Tax=Kitasatospora kifunensis TaxID=58351 RepID=A0A7W7RBR9_KITKI|nr:hypothetical protein [Kitasatospora kifunensis]MBB4929057.1 hypothetical protein [Kitasatospora kifunensis]